MSPEVASKEAYTQLQAYVAKGVAGEKTNKFYSETGPNNSIVFPKIQGTATQLSVAAQERRNELNKLLTQDDTGLFSKPNSILTEQEIETSIGSYYANNGTFRIPVNVEYTSKILGVSPIAAINAQIEASNAKYGLNRRLLMPTPAEEAVFDQVPSVQKLFTDFTKSSQTRFNRGNAFVTGTTGPMRASMQSTSFNLDQLTDKDYNDLAYAISSEAALGTDDEFGVAANILTRLKTGGYGNTIEEIINAPGQYEGVYKGLSRPSPEIAAKLKSPEGKAKIKEFIKRLDGRTEFKGQTMLKNRVSSEDPMFDPAGNFYHYAGQ